MALNRLPEGKRKQSLLLQFQQLLDQAFKQRILNFGYDEGDSCSTITAHYEQNKETSCILQMHKLLQLLMFEALQLQHATLKTFSIVV
jgi:hypothetical protein